MKLFQDLWQDLRHGARGHIRNPGYATLTVLILALGIGSVTGLFSAVYGVFLQPLPYEAAHRLVLIANPNPARNVKSIGFSENELRELRARVGLVSDLADAYRLDLKLTDQVAPEMLGVGIVSPRYFDVLGVRALHGRLLSPEDFVKGGAPVVVLADDYAGSVFGDSASALGRHFGLGSQRFEVVGVIPRLPAYPLSVDAYIPTASSPLRADAAFQRNPDLRLPMRLIVGRMRYAATVSQVNAELTSVSAQLRAASPALYPRHEAWKYVATVMAQEVTQQARPAVLCLFSATAVVLLIACIDVANLALVRSMMRRRERALRSALGASQWRILRQLLAEGLLVSLPAGALGVLLAWYTTATLTQFAARLTPRAVEIGLSWPVLVFALGISVLSGLAACVLPAWHRDHATVAGALRQGGAGSAAAGTHRTRGALLAMQVALSVVLVGGATVLLRGLIGLANVDPGFDAQDVLRAQVSTRRFEPSRFDEFSAFFHRVLVQIKLVPQVEAAAVASRLPLDHGTASGTGLLVQGGNRVNDPGNADPPFSVVVVSEDYFSVLRVPTDAGRTFAASDDSAAPRVAVVSDALASRYWPGGARAVGASISLDSGRTWTTVVGVVGDVLLAGLNSGAVEAVYLPFSQVPFGTTLVVRTAPGATDVVRSIRTIVHRTDPAAAVVSIQPLSAELTAEVAPLRFTSTLAGTLAALTLVITLTGIAGLTALTARERRSEIGLRIALGAGRGHVIGLIVRQSVTMLIAGSACGTVATFALSRFLSASVFDVPAVEPVLVLGVVLALVAVGCAASVAPALRSARMDPTTSMKC